MNLIAEETVKLLERYPQEVAAVVADSITQPDWDNFVNETLREAREREAAPLAGGRPAAGRALNFASQGDGDVACERGLGACQRCSMLTPRTASSDDNDQFANYLSSQMGAGGVAGSDDDDSDEDASYLSQDIQGSARSQANGAGGGFDVSAVSSHRWPPAQPALTPTGCIRAAARLRRRRLIWLAGRE
jgi:SIT4-associating protein SAP185/190